MALPNLDRERPPRILAACIGWAILGLLAAFAQTNTPNAPPALLQARSAGYTVRQWTPADGLPSSRIQCLQQTRDGYLWIGTAEGLARFDGVQFKVIRSINCRCLTEDPEGTLWIGTENGLFRFGAGQLLPVPTNPQTTNAAGHKILALCPRRKGGVWVSDPDGLARAQGTVCEREWDTYRASNAILEDTAGQVWIGGNYEFYRWDPVAKRAQEMAAAIGTQPFSAWCFLEDSRKRFWVGGNWQVGQFLLGQQTTYSQIGTKFVPVCFTEDTSGTLWSGGASGSSFDP